MVEGIRVLGTDQRSIALDLACIDDDALGERLSVVVGAEIDFRRVEDDLWAQIAREGTDDPEVFSAHLRAVTWRSATAADRELFQSPFRAGIRLDPYPAPPAVQGVEAAARQSADRRRRGAWQDHRGGTCAARDAATPACGLCRRLRARGYDRPMAGRTGPEVRPLLHDRRPGVLGRGAAQRRVRGQPVGSVNAGEKLHRRAGGKMHHQGEHEGPRYRGPSCFRASIWRSSFRGGVCPWPA